MADVVPFRGWRYDLTKVSSLKDVIAPPYDVIDESLSDQLYSKSPYNVIRLILEKMLPTDDDSNNRYTRSSKYLQEWRSQGIVRQDERPALYAYYQTFDWEGQQYTRRGFMGRVRLEKFGSGSIYPHEQTMPGPKADRLKLFHATGMNLSQIFGLFPDPANDVARRLDEIVRGREPLVAVDHLNVRHQMWVIDDSSLIAELSGMLREKPIFIADGHHRYETSIKHMEEREAAGLVHGPDAPERFTLMMLVGMSDPGLQVMPTHRLVSGLGDITQEELSAKLAGEFDVELIGAGEVAGQETWRRILASGRQEALGFCTVGDGKWSLAMLKSLESMKDAAPEKSDVYRSLGVSILHRLVLEKLIARDVKCRYVHLVSEVLDGVRQKECQLACLVQPATVEHIRQLSGTFETMPAKSTYFYPKLASGLVFNPIHSGNG